jgi:Flp pilus assembly protein TadG
MRRSQHLRRRGVASIELAAVSLFLLVPLIIGVWELGRLVQVQQIVSNAAREGARLSAQAYTIDPNTGTPLQIKVNTGSVTVQNTVYNYLYAAGLTNLAPSDVTVAFAFTSPRTTDYLASASDPAGTSFPVGSYPTDPCYGDKGETFTVTVTIPWNRVRWVNLGIINPTTVSFTVTWQMLTDDQFTVNAQLPTW